MVEYENNPSNNCYFNLHLNNFEFDLIKFHFSEWSLELFSCKINSLFIEKDFCIENSHIKKKFSY